MLIGWVGFGRMGKAMTDCLVAAGHEILVWDPYVTVVSSENLKSAKSASDLAGCEVIFTMVPTGDDVLSACVGPDGVFSGTAAHATKHVVDCSTVSIETSAEIRAALTAKNIQFLATAISGNPAAITARAASLVCSGPDDTYEACRPLLSVFTQNPPLYVGPAEEARLCKIAHNMYLGSSFAALVEAMLLAERGGIDRKTFLGFLGNTVLSSGLLKIKTPALVNEDWTPTFTAPLLLKDMNIAITLANETDLTVRVAEATATIIRKHLQAAERAPDSAAFLEKDYAFISTTMAGTDE